MNHIKEILEEDEKFFYSLYEYYAKRFLIDGENTDKKAITSFIIAETIKAILLLLNDNEDSYTKVLQKLLPFSHHIDVKSFDFLE